MTTEPYNGLERLGEMDELEEGREMDERARTTREIAKLITDNPDLPILFFVDPWYACEEYAYTAMNGIVAFIDCPIDGSMFPPLDEDRMYLLDSDEEEIRDRFEEARAEEEFRTYPITDEQQRQLEREADEFEAGLPTDRTIIIFASV